RAWPWRPRWSLLEHLSRGGVHGDSLARSVGHGHRLLDRGRGGRADPGHLRDVRELGLPELLERAEVLEQRLAAYLAKAGYVVQQALDHRLGPPRPMVGDREAVRLVTDPLEEVEPLGRAPQDDRVLL